MVANQFDKCFKTLYVYDKIMTTAKRFDWCLFAMEMLQTTEIPDLFGFQQSFPISSMTQVSKSILFLCNAAMRSGFPSKTIPKI